MALIQRMVVAAVLFGCLSCGPALRGGPVYVGSVEGTDALVAVVTDGNSVIGYVCGQQTWDSRTGWFLTELEDGAQSFGTIAAADSASGHHLEGTITAEQASGTIRFADGSTHRFTAETADPKAGAGLFENHASEGKAGLIITNDGKSAGAATVNSGATTTTLQTTLTSSTTTGVTVSIPGVDVTTSTLTTLPPLVPAQNLVSATGPTLFIVVHGMSDPINTPASAIDTPSYSREEWSLDYFQGLLGGVDTKGGPQSPMFNFHGQNITNHYSDPAFLPKFDPNTPEAQIATTGQLAAHFLTLQNPGGDVATQTLAPPQLSAFVTYRDSTGGLVQSGQRIANQAYLAIRYYELRFRRTPKVVFVTQSFGGPTVRFVLSNPTQAQLDAPGMGFNQDHLVLSAEDRRRMDYVRDRIVYTVTQAGPHEGSFMADFGAPLEMDVTAIAKAVDQGATGLSAELAPIGAFYNMLSAMIVAVPDPTENATQALASVHEGMNDLEGLVNDRALRDLTRAFWARANVSLLPPKLARRTSASPILHAAGQLIPIYAMGGRSPGGRAFTAPELSAFQRFGVESPKEQGWIVSTMGTDLLLHATFPQGFGRADTGIYAPFQDKLDRRKRLVDAAAFSRGLINGLVDQINPWVGEKYGADVEGLLSETLGLSERVATPIWLDQNGHFDLGGSVQVPALAFQCTNDDGRVLRVVLDFGRLVTTIVGLYGSLTAAQTKLDKLDLNGTLNALGIAAADASDVADWFVQRYAKFALTSGRCQLPGASISSLLSIGNLANWQLTRGTDSFPAPRWVREGTPVSDGEIDDDGVVTYDSAMGFSLGTQTALFFDHTRTDFVDGAGNPAPGSWYRLFDSAVEIENHGMPRQFSTGHFIYSTIEQAGAGPRPGPGALSTF